MLEVPDRRFRTGHGQGDRGIGIDQVENQIVVSGAGLRYDVSPDRGI